MGDEDEWRGKDGAHLVLDDQLVTLEHPDLTRVGVVLDERGAETVNRKTVYCSSGKSTSLGNRRCP